MCLYPRLIRNPRYKPNKKNKGEPPKCEDIRKMWVPVGCGDCLECRQQLAQNWRIRLSEELKTTIEENKKAYFVTLTFNEEQLNHYKEYTNDENKICTLAVRQFLERWRKEHKKSVKHWLITELGHKGTERVHLHGIIFTEIQLTEEYLTKKWNNGFADIGKYCNNRTINYIVKYVTKIDNDHLDFRGKILTSKGIGAGYFLNIKQLKEINKKKIDREYNNLKGYGKKFNAYNGENTKEYYRTKEGYCLNLPMYYRNAIYSEEERDNLWTQKLDKNKRYILGTEYNFNTEKEIDTYYNALKTAQKKNIRLGYKEPKWRKEEYDKQHKEKIRDNNRHNL